MDDKFLDWFSGLVDGEGHFGIYITSRKRCKGVSAQFRIKMRDDDAEMLLNIRDSLGFGNVCRASVPKNATRNSKPQFIYFISSIEDDLKLVRIFDDHPLRSKKIRDYLVWREAVIYFSKYGFTGAEQLSYASKIKKCREYTGTSVLLQNLRKDGIV